MMVLLILTSFIAISIGILFFSGSIANTTVFFIHITYICRTRGVMARMGATSTLHATANPNAAAYFLAHLLQDITLTQNPKP